MVELRNGSAWAHLAPADIPKTLQNGCRRRRIDVANDRGTKICSHAPGRSLEMDRGVRVIRAKPWFWPAARRSGVFASAPGAEQPPTAASRVDVFSGFGSA